MLKVDKEGYVEGYIDGYLEAYKKGLVDANEHWKKILIEKLKELKVKKERKE